MNKTCMDVMIGMKSRALPEPIPVGQNHFLLFDLLLIAQISNLQLDTRLVNPGAFALIVTLISNIFA